MSKFKPSAITPEHRGKLGNIVFSKNKYGPYSALKTNPTDKKTDAQMRVRASMANLSRIYSNNLNKLQYQGWSKLVSKITRTDSSGNKYNPAPRDIFIACNFNFSELGLPLMFDPPKKLSVQSFNSFKIEIFTDNDNNDIRLFFKPAISEDTRIMIFATKFLSNSLSYFRDSLFKKIGYIDSGFKSGDSIISLYKSIPYFNCVLDGSFQIAFRLKPVSCSSGFSKDLIKTSASVYQNIL